MKILKAKIKVDHRGGGTKYEYPQIWLDNKENINPIFYPKDRTDEATDGTVGLHQVVYPNVPDAVATQMLADHPDIFSTADRTEFETYTDKHNPVKEIVTDQEAVLTVLAKVARKEKLTLEDEAVIDPLNEAAGVKKSKRMIDLALEYDATF